MPRGSLLLKTVVVVGIVLLTLPVLITSDNDITHNSEMVASSEQNELGQPIDTFQKRNIAPLSALNTARQQEATTLNTWPWLSDRVRADWEVRSTYDLKMSSYGGIDQEKSLSRSGLEIKRRNTRGIDLINIDQGNNNKIIDQGNNNQIIHQGNNNQNIDQGNNNQIIHQGNNNQNINQGNNNQNIDEGYDHKNYTENDKGNYQTNDRIIIQGNYQNNYPANNGPNYQWSGRENTGGNNEWNYPQYYGGNGPLDDNLRNQGDHEQYDNEFKQGQSELYIRYKWHGNGNSPPELDFDQREFIASVGAVAEFSRDSEGDNVIMIRQQEGHDPQQNPNDYRTGEAHKGTDNSSSKSIGDQDICCSTIESWYTHNSLVDTKGVEYTIAQRKHTGSYQFIREGSCGGKGLCAGKCVISYATLSLAVIHTEHKYRFFKVPGHCSCKVFG